MSVIEDIRKALRTKPEPYRPPQRLLLALKLILRGKPEDIAEARARLGVDVTTPRAAPEGEAQRLDELLHQCLRLGMFHMLEAVSEAKAPEDRRVKIGFGVRDEQLWRDLREILRQMRASGAKHRGIVMPQTIEELLMRMVRKGVVEWRLNEERGGAAKRTVARWRLEPGEKQPMPESFGAVLSGETAAKVRAAAVAEGITLGAWVARACALVADGEGREAARKGSRKAGR